MRYPKFFRSHPAAKRRVARSVLNSNRHVSAQIEQLEQRDLLSGLNLLESVFDTSQFASNLEEQVPVDSFGGNGVVGYSYTIVDGDPDNPITGAGGNAVMPWDGPLGAFSVLSTPQRRQEIASISKAVTSYTSIDHVVLNAGGLSDTIDALSSVLSMDLTLHGNGGNDAFNVGNGDLDAVGGSGIDTVIIYDQNDVSDNPYSVDNNSVTKPTFDLGYSEVESLTLNANPFNNLILYV